MAVVSNIEKDQYWFHGEAKDLLYDVTQSDGTTPQTMTGWTLKWSLTTPKGKEVMSLTTTGGDITIGNGAGTDDRATVSVTVSDYNGVTGVTFSSRLERTDGGNESVLAFGSVYLHP